MLLSYLELCQAVKEVEPAGSYSWRDGTVATIEGPPPIRDLWEGDRESYCWMVTEFLMRKWKRSGNRQWRWLRDTVSVLTITDLCSLNRSSWAGWCTPAVSAQWVAAGEGWQPGAWHGRLRGLVRWWIKVRNKKRPGGVISVWTAWVKSHISPPPKRKIGHISKFCYVNFTM